MENMGSKMKKMSTNIIDYSDKRKPIMRRRSHTRRRVPQDCVINMAEARREIVHALHLHRSSSRTASSSSSSSSSTTTSISSSATMLGNCNSNYFSSDKATTNTIGSSLSSSSSSQCYCYSLTESMPLPEPIWSTTEPSIPAATPPVAAAMEGLEFEYWGDNQASTYSWWLGFLKALDSKNSSCLDRIHVKDTCKLGIGEEHFVDANNDQDYQVREWLMFPTTDDDHQNERANFK